jgi:hypothetical protein
MNLVQQAIWGIEAGKLPLQMRSHVYLGIWDLGVDFVFLKPGKANDPKKRAKGFNTHLPGGLTAMKALPVDSENVAFILESKLIEALLQIDGAKQIGGEWIQLHAARKDEAIAVFTAQSDQVFDVDLPKASPVQKKVAYLATDESIKRHYFEAQKIAEVVIQQKKRRGVAGEYAGTPRA